MRCDVGGGILACADLQCQEARESFEGAERVGGKGEWASENLNFLRKDLVISGCYPYTYLTLYPMNNSIYLSDKRELVIIIGADKNSYLSLEDLWAVRYLQGLAYLRSLIVDPILRSLRD